MQQQLRLLVDALSHKLARKRTRVQTYKHTVLELKQAISSLEVQMARDAAGHRVELSQEKTTVRALQEQLESSRRQAIRAQEQLALSKPTVRCDCQARDQAELRQCRYRVEELEEENRELNNKLIGKVQQIYVLERMAEQQPYFKRTWRDDMFGQLKSILIKK